MAPDTLCYRTERGIHNNCYWKKILSVIDKSKHARLEGVVKGATVYIQTENISALMIKLPNNIKYVRINGMERPYYKTQTGSRIYRVTVGEGVKELFATDPYFHLYGNGLLQIYMSKVSIFVDVTGLSLIHI